MNGGKDTLVDKLCEALDAVGAGAGRRDGLGESEGITYTVGSWKYQLKFDFLCWVNVFPDKDIVTKYIELTTRGELLIRAGYAYDGPSWPAIDTENFMCSSLAHDALYQLMREGLLDRKKLRKIADEDLRRMSVEAGMSRARARVVWIAVRLFGGRATKIKAKRKTKYARRWRMSRWTRSAGKSSPNADD